MPQITRIQHVCNHIAIFGPITTRQAMNIFGWPLSTASSVMSHAKAYGFLVEAGFIPPADPTKGGKGQTIWNVAQRKKNMEPVCRLQFRSD